MAERHEQSLYFKVKESIRKLTDKQEILDAIEAAKQEIIREIRRRLG